MGTTLGFGVDVGGSGIKGCTVDLDAGKLHGDRIRIPTPDPSKPDAVADVVKEIVDQFGWHGPVGVTLPAVTTSVSLDFVPTSWIAASRTVLASVAASMATSVAVSRRTSAPTTRPIRPLPANLRGTAS